MKFSNAYHTTLSTGVNVSNSFVEKVIGIFKKDSKAAADDRSNGLFMKAVINGEASCEVSVEELKELFAENKESMDLLYDWIKNGKLKAVTDGMIKLFVDAIRTGAKEGKAIAEEIMSED